MWLHHPGAELSQAGMLMLHILTHINIFSIITFLFKLFLIIFWKIILIIKIVSFFTAIWG